MLSSQIEQIFKTLLLLLCVILLGIIFCNVIYLGINLCIVAVIYTAFAKISFIGLALFLIGLLFNITIVGIASIYLAILCVRFRDVPFIIQNIMQVMFFVTPIIWRMDDMGNRFRILEFNPFYILIELVRAPLINGYINKIHLFSMLSVSCIALVGLFFLVKNIKNNIAYWV